MTLICVGASKGSPGATLTALGLAAAWRVGANQRKVLIEADPSGGSLALRYQLPTSPGLLSLAARAASGLDATQLWASAQELPGGLAAVLAPDRSDQIDIALRSAGAMIGRWLADTPDVIAIVDVGRMGAEPGIQPLTAAADAVLLVARPQAEQLQPASHLLEALSPEAPAGWVLVGTSPYSAEDVAGAYRIPVVGVLPDDARAARSMETGAAPSRLRRSLLVREFGVLAERVRSSVAEDPAHSTSESIIHGKNPETEPLVPAQGNGS